MQTPAPLTDLFGRLARAAVATARGDRGIVRTRRAENAAMRRQIARRTRAERRAVVASADPMDARRLAATRRRAFFPKLRAELLAQLHAESIELLPVLGQHEVTRAAASEGAQEARSIEAILDELSLLRYDAPDWPEVFASLARAVDAHTRHQDGRLLPLAARALTPERIREIDRRYRLEKKRRMRSLRETVH